MSFFLTTANSAPQGQIRYQCSYKQSMLNLWLAGKPISELNVEENI
jgi:hypothetical protein